MVCSSYFYPRPQTNFPLKIFSENQLKYFKILSAPKWKAVVWLGCCEMTTVTQQGDKALRLAIVPSVV